MKRKLIEFKIKRLGPIIRISIPYQHEVLERGHFRGTTKINDSKVIIRSYANLHIHKNKFGSIELLCINGTLKDRSIFVF